MGNATVGDQFTLLETAFYLSNGVLGALFNALVLFIAFRHIDTGDKPRQIIVMHMTAADLLMCIVYMLTRPYLKSFPLLSCHPYYITIWTCQMCSCINLLWLNVDKLLYIKWPLHYYNIVNRAKFIILSTTTWAALFACAIIVDWSMSVKDSCTRVQINPYIYLPICIFYVVVIIASFAISAVIFLIAQTHKMEQRDKSKMFKRLFFLFSSTMWTMLTCLPYRVFYLMFMLCNPCITPTLSALIDLFFRVLVIGTVLNPIITIVTQRIYRVRVYLYWQQIKAFVWRSPAPPVYGSAKKPRKSRATLEDVDQINTSTTMEHRALTTNV